MAILSANEAAERYHWYALRVPPQKEFVAAEILRRKGLATFLPVERLWRRKNKYVKEKVLRTYALMPRHVFTGFDKRAVSWFNVFELPAIQGVVGRNGTPLKLDEDGMARIMRLYENGIKAPDEQQWMQTHKEFAIGDTVQIMGGVFDGWKVPVVAIMKSEARVIVELFGMPREIEISTGQLVAAA
jgi:transcription antitermination factor NusG